MNIIKNKEPKLLMPSFSVDTQLSKKLNEYDITRLMNKSNFSLFLGKSGSGKTLLMTSFLKPSALFKKVYHNVFLFMPSNSRNSMKDNFFDKNIPEDQIFDNVSYEDLLSVYDIAKENALENFNTLIIFDDTQKYFKEKSIEKLLLHIINNRRHARISIWLCCQNYITIPKTIRQGLTDLFIFKINKTEMENIFNEQIEQFKDNFMNIMKNVYDKSHTFLYINTNSQRLFKNWDEIIIKE
jgi:putative ribosome biogenesis GTPase RsgA